jgi:hydroxypyruvate isomerase
MPNRREFLAGSGVGLAVLSTGWGPPKAAADSTWLTYAPDLELFWRKLPFLERLKKLSEAGFSRYEFGRWKTKDLDAIAKRNEEFGLQAALFLGYPGLKGPRWKEGLLEAAPDSAELASKLGAVKVSVVAADRDEKVDRQEQVDELVDALKEAVEKVAEFEAVLILETSRAVSNRPKPLIASVDEAAAVVKAVGSDRIKFAFSIGAAEVAEGKLADSLAKHKGQAGYYRLNDFGSPGANEPHYTRVLKTIHDLGYSDPIGLGLASKADPSAAIELIRKLDAAAKAL